MLSPAEAAAELLRRNSEPHVVMRRVVAETGELISVTECYRNGRSTRVWADGRIVEGRRVRRIGPPG